MPISLEDLLGGRIECEVVSARMGTVEGQSCLIVSVKISGEESEFRYGVLPVGDLINRVLAEGKKTADGKIMLRLPPPNRRSRITWVNAY